MTIKKILQTSLLIFFLINLATSPSYSQTAKTWKTGQTNVIKTGDDGDLQKGAAWPCPRFVDNGDGTVTDYLTGLMWLKNANCSGLEATWDDAFTYITELNTYGTMNSNSCGDISNNGFQQTDWRLPNRKEFISLLDWSANDPAMPSDHPFDNVENLSYWTSSTYANNTNNKWRISIGSGSMAHKSNTKTYYVWAVRDGELSYTYNLTIKTNGTGSGEVSHAPKGTICGSDEVYLDGTEVVLSATPSSDSYFTGWSGGGCTGTDDCTVTMDADQTITATFNSGGGGGGCTPVFAADGQGEHQVYFDLSLLWLPILAIFFTARRRRITRS